MSYNSILYGFITVLAIYFVLTQCANPIALRGGPTDEDPPVLLIEESTGNYQTLFTKQDIKLYFDEYINIRDVTKYVIISPPMNQNLQIDARGKSVTIKFPDEEQLKQDATYVINFGDAIRDFNEGNILSNFRFIFSTGEFIDSLKLTGTVKDAFTGDPLKDVYVMLYEDHSDSVVYLRRPFYFASSDNNGKFSIENIRSDSFKIFALKDANLNYIYDQESEVIGFIDSLIVVSDSTELDINIKMFMEKSDFKLEDFDVRSYGFATFNFNDDARRIKISTNLDQLKQKVFKVRKSNDSLYVWYEFGLDTNFVFYLTDEETYFDTIRVRRTEKNRFLQEQNLQMKLGNLENRKFLSPFDSLFVRFNHPIDSFDHNKFHIFKDSIVERVELLSDINDERNLYILADWLQDSSYQLKIDSAAVHDIYGLPSDSLKSEVVVKTADDYGTIRIEYNSLQTDRQHIVHLKQGNKIVHRSIIDRASGVLEYLHLLPGNYSLEFIEDLNFNNAWDPGNYLEKRQPEKVVRLELDALRANWEVVKQVNSGLFDNLTME